MRDLLYVGSESIGSAWRGRSCRIGRKRERTAFFTDERFWDLKFRDAEIEQGL